MQDFTGMFEKVAGRSKYHMAVKAENAIFNGVRNGRVAELLRKSTGSVTKREQSLLNRLEHRGQQQVDAAFNRVERLYGKIPDGFNDRTTEGLDAGYEHGMSLLRKGFTAKDLKPAR